MVPGRLLIPDFNLLISVIISGFTLAYMTKEPATGIAGGVLIGGALQLFIQAPLLLNISERESIPA